MTKAQAPYKPEDKIWVQATVVQVPPPNSAGAQCGIVIVRMDAPGVFDLLPQPVTVDITKPRKESTKC